MLHCKNLPDYIENLINGQTDECMMVNYVKTMELKPDEKGDFPLVAKLTNLKYSKELNSKQNPNKTVVNQIPKSSYISPEQIAEE